MTQTSTAARRITRALNAHGPHWTIAFDTAGRVTGQVHGQHVDTRHLGGHINFASRGGFGDRWTQRQVQDHLDATAEAARIDWLGLAGVILDAWSFADECGNPRPTAERVADAQRAVLAELAAEGVL